MDGWSLPRFEGYLDDEDTECRRMLELVELDDKIEIYSKKLAGFEYEVILDHNGATPHYTYYFSDHDEARAKAKELYPNTDWETTGW